MTKIHPVIMSGGSGTRLWPISRALYPKQFLKLASQHTMLQDAVLRVRDDAQFAPPIIICAEEHRFIIAEQLRTLGITPQAIILEPMPRSTAAVAALASLHLAQADKDALFLLMPTDHAIGDVTAFKNACAQAALAAREGKLVTFGIRPDHPETGYGYIKPGAGLGHGSAHAIERFVEKPDKARAEDYVAQGYLWNSGIFLFGVTSVRDELTRLQPEIVARVTEALSKGTRDKDFLRLDKDAFSAVPAISLDYGLMEKTSHAAVVPVDMAWHDIGSWAAMWEFAPKDDGGNVAKGDVQLTESHNCYVHSDGPLTCTLGLTNTIVIALDDVVMVADMARAQDVKLVVDQLKSKGREEVQHARRVYRPWGWYESLGGGARFQIKRLMVNPGCRLSLQMHYHRSEHWVVVEGMGEVTRNGDTLLVYENESVYLPAGAQHRLSNPGKVPLVVVEVQSGTYLGEDDIVRLEDSYGRL